MCTLVYLRSRASLRSPGFRILCIPHPVEHAKKVTRHMPPSIELPELPVFE
ncbi:uncharacterized protein RSE6_04854 [Rhynchosporium secalis]|uniref:Uncharacterized protein n=1 Tax=Rhynchosporium secalis TaxID=38038 RepID=A0A1E1M7M3_RHYSE|nr:uncharacterized protein RSE6_04854 [Rhynchosporium secalis]